MRNPISFQQYLQNHQQLQQLCSQIQNQQKLLHKIKQLLPDTLAPHCYTAVQRQTQLILTTDSPVWANRLRYQAPSLLQQIRVTKPNIANIKVHSRPQPRPAVLHTPLPKIQRTSNTNQASLVYDSARHTQHPALCNALQRLAKTLYEHRF
jgi:hypothetical protein